jgi:uncharacterized membrane protein
MDVEEEKVLSSAASRQAARFHAPHRLNALADGVFAIAMTLLALEIRIPEGIADGDHEKFREALGDLFGGLALFALAFFVTSQYWFGHHRVMSFVHAVDGRAIMHTVTALMGVAALPIALHLMVSWGQWPEAVAISSGMLALTSLLSLRSYHYVLKDEFADIDALTRRRTLIQPLINATAYLITIPLAYGAFALGWHPAWVLTFWFLLGFTRPLATLFTRKAKPA